MAHIQYNDGFLPPYLRREQCINDMVLHLNKLQDEEFTIYPITITFIQIKKSVDENGIKKYYVDEKDFNTYEDAYKYLFEYYSKIIFDRISKYLDKKIFKRNQKQIPYLFLFPDNKHKYKGKTIDPYEPEIPHLHGFIVIHPNEGHKVEFKALLKNGIMSELGLDKFKYLNKVHIVDEVRDIQKSVNYAAYFMQYDEYTKYMLDTEADYILRCHDSKNIKYNHLKNNYPKCSNITPERTIQEQQDNFNINRAFITQINPSYFKQGVQSKNMSAGKSNKEIFNNTLNCRIDDKRRSKVEECCAHMGIGMSEFIRQLIDDFLLQSSINDQDIVLN